MIMAEMEKGSESLNEKERQAAEGTEKPHVADEGKQKAIDSHQPERNPENHSIESTPEEEKQSAETGNVDSPENSAPESEGEKTTPDHVKETSGQTDDSPEIAADSTSQEEPDTLLGESDMEGTASDTMAEVKDSAETDKTGIEEPFVKKESASKETASESDANVNEDTHSDSASVTTAEKEESTAQSEGGEEEPDTQDRGKTVEANNKTDETVSDPHDKEVDYASMNMENLVGELQLLLRTSSIATISKKVNQIRHEFDRKFKIYLEEKKEEFISNGGNEIDFRYQSVAKRQFNELMAEYREKRDQHYKQIERELKENLSKRLEIIEELKSLINVEEDMHHTYKNFKEIQEKWRNAGPVPRNEYNNLWQTYHHHTEIFYDFLHLNRELRDLDFQHNLEEKEKLIRRAEELKDEPDLNKALFELQSLHKIWKEDVGPVAKEKRDDVWNRFSDATKAIHHRRQEHFKELEAQQGINLERKKEIIQQIQDIADNAATEHKALQGQIRKIEKLREEFLALGRVPKSKRDETWSEFKGAVRSFNRKKNSLYKELKQEQLENLNKKRALVEKALALKDSDDHEVATPEMKRIQNEWKKIGHVPRKYSDKIWAEFKGACNEYFDRIHSEKREEHKAENENFQTKKKVLERLEKVKLSGTKEKDMEIIKGFISEWKELGRVPAGKRDINDRFNKHIDQLFSQLNIDQKESQILRYGDKLKELSEGNDKRAVLKERSFIKRKIDESRQEIRQLENNMEFFSGSSNPLVQEVQKKIDKHKSVLEVWEGKLKNANILLNRLKKEEEAEAAGEEEVPEEE